jgi:hypothetical protein
MVHSSCRFGVRNSPPRVHRFDVLRPLKNRANA